MQILVAALMIIAFLCFATAYVDRGPKEPSAVRLIGLGLALWILAVLIPVLAGGR